MEKRQRCAQAICMTSFVEITRRTRIPESAAGNAGDAEADSDVDAYTCTVRTDPSLIALDVLRAMDALELLQAETNPKHGGDWIDENGMALPWWSTASWPGRSRTPAEKVSTNPCGTAGTRSSR